MVNDRGRLSGLLRDLCENECKAEISLFLTALDDGVAEELLTHSKSTDPNLLVSRLVKSLREDRLLTEEAARWVVESWAFALGVVEEAELSRAKCIIPPTPSISMPLPSMPASSAQPQPIVPNQHLSSPSLSTQPLPMPQTSHVWKGLVVIALLIIGGAFIKNGLDKEEQARLMESDRIRAEQATRDSEKSRQEMERARQKLDQATRDAEHWQKQAELEKQRRLTEIERLKTDSAAYQPSTWTADWGHKIEATATMTKCSDVEFFRNGYIYLYFCFHSN